MRTGEGKGFRAEGWPGTGPRRRKTGCGEAAVGCRAVFGPGRPRDGRQVRSTPSADPLSRGADHSASGEPGLSVSMGTKLMTFRLGQFPRHWVTSMTNMHDHLRCHTCQLRTWHTFHSPAAPICTVADADVIESTGSQNKGHSLSLCTVFTQRRLSGRAPGLRQDLRTTV